jgi:predicted O-methyltransferase YrrM
MIVPTAAPTSFDEAFAAVSDVEGWMTPDQARRLWDRASELGEGSRIVEIGSFRGRSAIVLASAAAAGTEVVAIDPHIGTDRGPQEIVTTEALGQSDNEVFNANLDGAGVRERIRHVRKKSEDALGDVDGAIDLLYIDGAHRYGPARDDIVRWGERVVAGGTLLIHDSFSSVGVTLALLQSTTFGGSWTYIGRSQSMAEYRHTPSRGSGRARNVGRQLAQLPWFLRNVVIKVLMVAKLGRLTRFLGHDAETWPY